MPDKKEKPNLSVRFGAASQICLHPRTGMCADYGFAPSSRREQQSTGLLHLVFQICLLITKKPILSDELFVLELLARFELATRSSETLVSLEPYDLVIESALRAWDSVASVYLMPDKKEKTEPFGSVWSC